LILACGTAFVLVGSLKGRTAKLNRVDLVDIDNETGVTRGVNWTHAFSPASGEMRYDFRFVPQENAPGGDNAEVVASWMGMPGRALGGMNPTIVDTNQSAKPYEFSQNLDALTGVPIPAASSKSLIARWRAKSPPLVAAALQASERGGLTDGSALTWNGSVSLPDAYLFHDRWVYRLGDLMPGRQVRPEIDRRKAVLSKLRRQRIVDGKEVVTRFDPTNLDPQFVVESMLFHASSGGSKYTAGLENRYMGVSDMSRWLRPDTAILVGQPKDAILEVDFREADGDQEVSAESRHSTYLRVILPVEIIQ
ncbi:MAG: hypothetical protein MI757_17320, partial [Pirellulales bacterium]|nr:hypothetical protein [Pirellulales bacterium]